MFHVLLLFKRQKESLCIFLWDVSYVGASVVCSTGENLCPPGIKYLFLVRVGFVQQPTLRPGLNIAHFGYQTWVVFQGKTLYVMRGTVYFVGAGSANGTGVSDCSAGWIPPALSLWEARSCAVEEDLSHLCLSWDGGLMALNDLVFHSSIPCCFSSHENRENVENWAGHEKIISSPHASSRFAS